MIVDIYGEKEEFLNLNEYITKFSDLNNLKIKTLFHDNEKFFLKKVKEKKIETAYLIHSENFPNMFDIAAEIKKQNIKSKVIFCSYLSRYAVDGYKIGLSYYLLMPFLYNDVQISIKKWANINSKYIIINSNWQKISIPYEEIHFVEKQGHNVVIHTQTQNYHTRTTFKDFLSNFKNKENFNNCTRGTIINFDWVKTIKLQNFLMKNGEKISIRRKDRKLIKDLFFNYKLKKNNFD